MEKLQSSGFSVVHSKFKGKADCSLLIYMHLLVREVKIISCFENVAIEKIVCFVFLFQAIVPT